jgi:hypothetical protein
VAETGTFTMQDGEISGNTAVGGGGIAVGETGTFIMQGGKISANKAKGAGGGVAVFDSGTFAMQSGEISGNTTEGAGGGVGVAETGTFTMRDMARIDPGNPVGLDCGLYSYASITIGGNFTGPAGPVAKIDLYAASDPASNWSGKAVIKLAGGYNGRMATLKDRFILGNFVRRVGFGYLTDPIIGYGYEIGANGTLQASGR